jgi:glycosyltransferase involved in cell wall biosynthesis
LQGASKVNAPVRVSLAIPLFNEADLVPLLVLRIGRLMDRLPGGPHEAVLVDDGSMDHTLERLEAAAAKDHRLVVVSLSRNFGHQAALSAALDHARGDVVVVMDGDLQDPPEVVPEFIEWYQRGYDVVYATRIRRKESWRLRLSYYAYYRLLRAVASLDLPLDSGDFGLMSRRVVDHIRSTPERHRYLRGLRRWVGFRQIGIPVERASRATGDSKYGLWKLLRLASDGLFSFSVVPLRAATLLGVIAVVSSTLFALYAVVAKYLLDRSPRGFTALILVITFLAGVNLSFLGIIGEYVGRIYEQVKGRPVYIVGRVIRSSDAPSVSDDAR